MEFEGFGTWFGAEGFAESSSGGEHGGGQGGVELARREAKGDCESEFRALQLFSLLLFETDF